MGIGIGNASEKLDSRWLLDQLIEHYVDEVERYNAAGEMNSQARAEQRGRFDMLVTAACTLYALDLDKAMGWVAAQVDELMADRAHQRRS